MTRETLDAHYGEIGRAVDGTLPGCSYSREVVFDVEQDPDMDYLGALTCVEDVLTDNMLEIPVDKVISGSGSPATNYPRAALASAIPPTPNYYIQMTFVANQGSDDSYLGIYARYTAIPSGSPEIGDAQYYLLKIFPYVSSEGGSVFQLIRGLHGGISDVISTSTHTAFHGAARFRWEISGNSHIVKDMTGAVLGVRLPVLTAADVMLTSAGSVGLVVMDGTVTGRDIKIDEVKASRITGQTSSITSFLLYASSDGPQRKMRLNSDGTLLAVGCQNDQNAPGGGNSTALLNGGAVIFKKELVWERYAEAIPYSDDYWLTNNGYSTDMADDGTVITADSVGAALHVFDVVLPVWTEQATFSGGGHHPAINDGDTLGHNLENLKISRDGRVIVTSDFHRAGNVQQLEIYTRLTGTSWTHAQTISLSGDEWFGEADVSNDGETIVTTILDYTTPSALTIAVRTYQTGNWNTWSQIGSDAPLSTDQSTWDNSSEFQDSRDANEIVLGGGNCRTVVVGLGVRNPNNGGTPFADIGAVCILTGTPGAYSQIAYIWQNLPAQDFGFYFGGALAISDFGNRLVIGDPYGGLDSVGRVLYFDSVQDLSGEVALESGTVLTTPQRFIPLGTFYNFGLSVTINAGGNVIAAMAGDFSEAQQVTVTIYENP